MNKTHLLMSMQAVSSRDEHAMETEESIISTVIVTTSPLYELFKLYYFHLLVLLVRSETHFFELLHLQLGLEAPPCTRTSEGAFCSYCHYLLTIMIETKHIKVRNKHVWLLLTKIGL